MCSLGQMSMWRGAWGFTSWKATTWSSWCAMRAGIRPSMILQNRQSDDAVVMRSSPARGSCGALDVGTESAQLLLDALVSAVDVIDAVDGAAPLGGERG